MQTETAAAAALVKFGPLKVRHADSDDWAERFCVVTNSVLLVYADEAGRGRPGDSLALTLATSVRRVDGSNPCVIELRSGGRRVQLCAASVLERDAWASLVESNIRHHRVVAPGSPLTMEMVVRTARTLAASDEEYDVMFPEKRKLGIDLLRVRNWGVVLTSAKREVTSGSVLSHVNGAPMLLRSYEELSQLVLTAGWPLTLTFRRPRARDGQAMVKLLAASDSAAQQAAAEFEPRRYTISAGAIKFFSLAHQLQAQVVLTGAKFAPLPGNNVVLLRVATHTVLLQKDSPEDLLEMGAALYHAIALANGGHYVLELEARRQAGAGHGGGDSDAVAVSEDDPDDVAAAKLVAISLAAAERERFTAEVRSVNRLHTEVDLARFGDVQTPDFYVVRAEERALPVVAPAVPRVAETSAAPPRATIVKQAAARRQSLGAAARDIVRSESMSMAERLEALGGVLEEGASGSVEEGEAAGAGASAVAAVAEEPEPEPVAEPEPEPAPEPEPEPEQDLPMPTPEQVDHAFAALDVYQSGSVSVPIFVASLRSLANEGNAFRAMKRFHDIDRNGSGSILAVEWVTYALTHAANDPQLAAWIHRLNDKYEAARAAPAPRRSTLKRAGSMGL